MVAPKPASRFQADGRVMRITRPAYARVDAVKQAMEAEKQRQVTYSEVLDYLVDHWEATERLVRDAREAGR